MAKIICEISVMYAIAFNALAMKEFVPIISFDYQLYIKLINCIFKKNFTHNHKESVSRSITLEGTTTYLDMYDKHSPRITRAFLCLLSTYLHVLKVVVSQASEQ